jgi:CPA1 family monovalent cation:H+ antiporter
VAVFVSAAGIGFTLSFVGGVPLTVALLLGSIVATTDPAAVVGIFRDLGVPLRLVRLVEGESLLSDAAAIVLFTTLLRIISEGIHPGLSASAFHFAESFGGGLLLGFVGGRVFGALVPLLGGARLAEVTLSLALPYIVYLTGEEVFDVSGVVAVVSAGLIAGAGGRAAEAGQLALSGAGLGADRLPGQLADLHHGLSPGAEALVHPEHP